jgi:murein DD-endopeptidase MepM/ murein hydrolase activator NlpD
MWRQPFPDKMLADHFGSHSPARKKMGLGPHRGVDWNGMKKGAPCPAVNDGVIAMNKWSDVLGWVVVLQVGKHFFGYCHLDKQSPLKVGTKVKSGDTVGLAGTSGSASSGVHLHFTLSLKVDGVFYGKVYDAHEFIAKQIAKQDLAKAKAEQPVLAFAEPTAENKVCEDCKKELK